MGKEKACYSIQSNEDSITAQQVGEKAQSSLSISKQYARRHHLVESFIPNRGLETSDIHGGRHTSKSFRTLLEDLLTHTHKKTTQGKFQLNTETISYPSRQKRDMEAHVLHPGRGGKRHTLLHDSLLE